MRTSEEGQLALAHLQQNGSLLPITDVHMPNVAGMQLIAAVRRDPQFAAIKILIFTSDCVLKVVVGRAMADDLVAWGKVRRSMQQHWALVLSPEHAYLLEAPFGEVAKAHQFANIAAYVDAGTAGDTHRPAIKALVDAMTTHMSSFSAVL